MIFWFQMVSGAALGWYLELFFGYLEMSLVDDFEKVIVFVCCVISYSPQTSCSLVTDMGGGLERSNTQIWYPSCPGSTSCPNVIFHVSKSRLFRSRACVSNSLRMRACVSACAFGLGTMQE